MGGSSLSCGSKVFKFSLGISLKGIYLNSAIKKLMKTREVLFNGQRSGETCHGGIFDEIS